MNINKVSLLLQLTQLPTAAGKEQRVIDFIRKWAKERAVALTESPAGNLHITMKARAGAANAPADPRPIYFTAHLDHPAFVVERIVAPDVLQLSFRGGVMDDYFKEAKVAVFDSNDTRYAARLTGKVDNTTGPFPHYLAELGADTDASSIALGDVAVWDLPRADVIDGILHTHACDDLAALAAALDAFDILLTKPAPTMDVRLLFTRAEEIGFIGAIAACREELMPKNSRVIALENSRSFADSPIGGGPIVRVGDRLSIFSPSLTDAIAKRAEELAGAAQPTASQKLAEAPKWKWQRKLMAGGACEASVFCAAGYEATCICLPLGNYHNMADLEAVQAGKNITPPVVGREYISIDDYFGLVDLLVACGERLPSVSPMADRIEKLWDERKFVLEA